MPSIKNLESNNILNSTFSTTISYVESPMFQNDSQKYALFFCSVIIGIGACCYFIIAVIKDRNIRKENNNTYETRNKLPGYAENDIVGQAKERFKRNNH
uniref:Small membrane protein n=1 Tax=Strongyloides stercoralis TaxID=6248 RepID=A0A0K0DX19_STRER